jgi:hypothetical protein
MFFCQSRGGTQDPNPTVEYYRIKLLKAYGLNVLDLVLFYHSNKIIKKEGKKNIYLQLSPKTVANYQVIASKHVEW